MNKIAQRISSAIERSHLHDKPFAIISNNCWGYELYNALGREYNSPFVGIFFFAECYLQFLENFDTYLDADLQFIRTSRHSPGPFNYPIGLLRGQVEIHFLHYTREEEALGVWNRRVARLREAIRARVPLFVKFCDRYHCTNNHMARFHALPFENKISIGIKPFDAHTHLCQPNLKDAGGDFVVDGVTLYWKRYHYFDVSAWIATGEVRQSLASRSLAMIS
jgi:uncharacterized protein (DUF1919 family)